MWRNRLKDHAREQTKRAANGRRVAVERLEKRLALSSSTGHEPIAEVIQFDGPTAGGFVTLDFDANRHSLNGGNAVPVLISPDLDSVVLIDSRILDREHLASDLGVDLGHNVDSTLNPDSVFFHTNDIQVISPPVMFPAEFDGGSVEIGEVIRTKDPQASEEATPEGSMRESTELSLFEAVSHRGSAVEITPERGRDISFRVATVGPPQSILKPVSVPFPTTTVQTGDADLAESPSRQDVDGSYRAADESESSVPLAPQSARDSIDTNVPTEGGAIPLPQPAAASTTSPIELGNSPAAASKSAERAAPRASSQSAVVGSAEEEARSRVFADWHNRDLNTLPMLVALVAGPTIASYLRGSTREAQQFPPKRGSQSAAL